MMVGSGLLTVNPPLIAAVPPPGDAFFTVTFLEPAGASMSIVMAAVHLVGEDTARAFTAMPFPNSTVVTPWKKFVPVSTTLTDSPLMPLVGVMFVRLGDGFVTTRPPVRVAVPPPGPELVIMTLRGPAAASDEIAMTATSSDALDIVTELMLIPEPKSIPVIPEMKLAPTQVTVREVPRVPLDGVMLVRVGAGFPITKAPGRVAVPPPGAGVVTVTSREPVGADPEIVMLRLICEALTTVVLLTVTPAPEILTTLSPLTKPDPVSVTDIVSPADPVVGDMLVSVGAGFAIVNAPASSAVPPPGAGLVT